MPLSFAGHAAAQLTPRLRALVERWLDANAPEPFVFPEYQVGAAAYLPFPSQPNPEKPKLDTLCWPSGASRWATFSGLWGGDAAIAIQELCGLDAPTPQQLYLESDSTVGPITADMHLIAVRPVYALGAQGENLFMLTLVCPRYFWWQAVQSYTFNPGDSWTTLLTNLATAASGLTPTVPTVPAAYGLPAPTRWTVSGAPLPPLIDAAAATVGLRFLYSPDGTCQFQTADDAATNDAARWTQNRADVVQGGRMIVDDVIGNVPANVAVSFWGDTPDVALKGLSSLALPAYGSATGVSSKYGWVRADRYVGQTSPTRTDYTNQAAADYYGWQLTLTEAVFRGIRNVAVTGLDDRVEWEYCPAIPCESGDDGGDVLSQRLPDVRVCTRVVPFPWGDRNVYGDRTPAGYTYPVRITAGPSGGGYKAVTRTRATGVTADGPQVGFGADLYNVFPTTGTPAVGDYGTAVPDPLRPATWLFTPAPSSTTGASACAGAIGWDATDCLLMSVTGAQDACADIDTTQQISLAWDGGGSEWLSATNFVFDGGSGPVTFKFINGVPTATIDGVYGFYLGCSGSGLLFAFDSTLCTGTHVSCGNNYFTVLFTCACCPDPAWSGPGWYCVAGACVYIPLPPPCDGVYDITGGPYIDEAACTLACGGGGGSVSVPCCPGVMLPATLTVTISGSYSGGAITGSITITWDGTWWTGTGTDSCSGTPALRIRCVLSPGGDPGNPADYFWDGEQGGSYVTLTGLNPTVSCGPPFAATIAANINNSACGDLDALVSYTIGP